MTTSMPNRGAVQIINIQNPARPVVLSTLAITPQQAMDIEVSGSYAYVGASYAGQFFTRSTIFTLDISDPAQPTVIGQYSFPSEPTLDIQLVGA